MLTVTFGSPFREAQSLVDPTIATSLYQIALAGHGYFLDTSINRFRMESIDTLRPQQDNQELAGEGSLSNVDLWRRSARSWHLGAGQSRGDDAESTPYRFFTSKGVDVWDKWKLSLLPEAPLAAAGAGSPSTVTVADGRAMYQAGDVIKVTDDGTTWVDLTTLASFPSTRMVSDGVALYAAAADLKVKKISSTGVVTDAFTLAAAAQVIGFSKGRLWAGIGATLYWMIPAGSPTSGVVAPTVGWVWTAICEGPRATYAAGYAGDRSQIYRIPLKSDGTGLDAGTVAWTAPDGEIVYSMTSYLGYVLIGTNKGVRFAVADDVGDLTPGSFIPTPNPVQALEPQDSFVWFGWSNYDTVSTGLGRVDLRNFTASLTPAYASDLLWPGQGIVTGVTTFLGKRLFTVEGQGVAAESAASIAVGSLQLSDWTFDIDDDKIATLLGIKHEPLDGTVSVSLVVDGAGAGVVAESSSPGSSGRSGPYSLNPIRAHRFALIIGMTPGTGTGPVVTGVKLMARPIPPQGARFIMPILLHDQADVSGVYRPVDPYVEFQFLRALWRNGASVTLQMGDEAFNVFPTNFEWIPYRETLDKSGWQGTCVMELREVTQ